MHQTEFVGKQSLVEALKAVPTRQVVHLQVDPAVLHLEPEGDETVLCEGKPVG